ncbi:uncharacterized protein LOC115531196 isoform X2 [Gadus morhua]|uniref:uncharacterized protein LOC115531196 isoform X2 n=1 Tax=Gadus morhua TaxID=8049 RepID=UPI0011B43CDA|nr:uncharacterized protein LOC115531196 isoform X2 [Gadus morhua]
MTCYSGAKCGAGADMDQSPLGSVLGHLAQMAERQGQLQQTQSEVLTELAQSLAAQSLAADRAVLRELLASGGRGEGPRGAGPVANIHVPKMGEADDAEAFLENFQAVAEVSGWPRQEWAHRLLPLLTGEAQLANHSLPAGAQQDYGTIARAIQDRLGLYPEEHRRRFRMLAFTEGDRPFAFAQQLRDQARWCLVPDQNSAENVVEQVALERFVEGLPARTSAWVRCHRPESLSAAVDLAESHLQPPPTAQRPPTPVPRTKPGTEGEGVPVPERAHESPPTPTPQTGDQTAGEGCWRCGRPGHFRRDCPLIEVGQVVRVTGAPSPPHGPGEASRIPVRMDTGGYAPGAVGLRLHADHDPPASGAVRGIGGGVKRFDGRVG